MANHHRGYRTLGLLSLFGSGVAGCHNPTICEPTSAALGQIVTSGVSEVYLAAVDKAGKDVPHLGCKAEATIATTKLFVRDSEEATCNSHGTQCLGTPAIDPHIEANPVNVQTAQGEFRVLGMAKGIAVEDCGQSAIKACNAGIDAYYNQQRAVRPPTIECRLADYQSNCEPGGRKPRVQVAAAPEPQMSPEDRLPATWIARLPDPKTRPVAIRALIHFHSDAMMRSNQNAADPAVKAVLDQIIDPLANTYVGGNLERSTRILLVRFLADTRDPRAGRAYVHACHGYATGAGPDEEDVFHASVAIGAMKYEEAAPALGEAFAKIEAGTPNGSAASKNVYGAMVQLKSAAWKPVLLEKIGRPMERPPRSGDGEKMGPYQSQLFWQKTSAELLGTLGDATATKPLLKITMEKDKSEVAPSALLGIVKIGSGAVPVLLDVLAGKDAEMVDFAKSKAGDAGGNTKSYVAASAMALGAIGRIDARAPMIQALKASDNEMNRAVVARELTALPASPDATKAFQAGYDKVPATASIWPSMFAARPALLTASSRFYDAEMVSWLLTQANAAKGKDEETMSAALGSAIKLMKGTSVAKVKTVVDKIGTDKDKSAFKAATEVLGKCAEDVDCYLSKLKDDDANVGLKAAHMVGMLGDTRAGMEVVKVLPSIANADVRAAAVLAVDHAVQKDGATVADALQKFVDDKAGEAPSASTSAEQVVYRLRGR